MLIGETIDSRWLFTIFMFLVLTGFAVFGDKLEVFYSGLYGLFD